MKRKNNSKKFSEEQKIKSREIKEIAITKETKKLEEPIKLRDDQEYEVSDDEIDKSEDSREQELEDIVSRTPNPANYNQAENQ